MSICAKFQLPSMSSLEVGRLVRQEVFFSWLPVNQGRVSQISCEIYVIHGQFYP